MTFTWCDRELVFMHKDGIHIMAIYLDIYLCIYETIYGYIFVTFTWCDRELDNLG